ncbi:UNVERIFIED_CONTAM: hypothetical protein Cloal_0223 [Acetivibrio alkalicellulosi]
MKNIITFLLCLFFAISNISAIIYANGIGNIDGGGGNLGSGTNMNYWSAGNDGVRVTVIRNEDRASVTKPIDFSNKNQPSMISYFEKKSKIQYLKNPVLVPKINGYVCYKPSKPLPRIIASNNYSINIDDTKKYFCSEYAVRLIADITGMSYETLTSGDYKMLLEPIAYLTFQGINMVMTAHEAALYDEKLGGGLRSKMVSLSHKNLPLALFLETPDLGFRAWEGKSNQNVSNYQIKEFLGLGIVRFSEADDMKNISEDVFEYRCNTDVITAIRVRTQNRRTPDNPASVTFKVNGRSYVVNEIYIPEEESQLIWFKWKTPTTPQTLNIYISANGVTVDKNQITAKIVDFKDKEPPNPTAKDRNNGFVIPRLPNKVHKNTVTWRKWTCYWKSRWIWKSNWKWNSQGNDGYWIDEGKWVDEGDWEYKWISYYARLSATMKMKPDSRVPIITKNTMRSGYGINIDVSTSLDSNAPRSDITGVQNVLSWYPEFEYKNYIRVLEQITSGYLSTFQLKENKYSTYGDRVHFTPVWFPDGEYIVCADIIDAWTPAGMLSLYLFADLNIDGSLYDDWYIGPQK